MAPKAGQKSAVARARLYSQSSNWNTATAQAWAVRKKFTEKELAAFNGFLTFLDTCYIKPSDITGHVKIDEGAFGEIDRAKWRGKNVVVKTVVQGVAKGKSTSQILRETLLETRILKALSHPNIVKFHGLAVNFPNDGEKSQEMQLGLIFEFCEKSSVINQIRKHKFTFSQKLNFARQIAEGMAYLHRQYILHRDLNTRNCLLTYDDTVRICDFGFARRLGGPNEMYDSTTISGTAEYMPPEQLSGDMLSLKTDVWAMGTILWEFGTGRAPWGALKGDIHGQLVKMVGKNGERLPDPEAGDIPQSPPAMSVEYCALMRRCMMTGAADRPSMAAVRDRLLVISQIAKGGSADGAECSVCFSNLFSCPSTWTSSSYDPKLNSTYSRSKDTSKPATMAGVAASPAPQQTSQQPPSSSRPSPGPSKPPTATATASLAVVASHSPGPSYPGPAPGAVRSRMQMSGGGAQWPAMPPGGGSMGPMAPPMGGMGQARGFSMAPMAPPPMSFGHNGYY